MCGRAFKTFTREELDLRYFEGEGQAVPEAALEPNYNLAPTQITPVVLVRGGVRTIGLFRWGLVPFWAKDVKSAARYSLINAKAEEIEKKRSFKNAFEHRRCLVPVSGFYEWQRSGKQKRPFAIQMKSEPIMSLAGVWEHWQSAQTGEQVDSFSVITTAANTAVAKIHDRMPVVLAKRDEQTWLDPANVDIALLKKLLTPCAPELLKLYEVSPLVNSVKNTGKELLRPARSGA